MKSPFKRNAEDNAPKRGEPKFDVPEGPKRKRGSRPTPYKWPGESPQGRGDFNRVADDKPSRVHRSNWMRGSFKGLAG